MAIASLPLFHQITGQKILVLGEGEAAEPKIRLVERAGGIVIGDMQQAIDEGVRIAFVAYEDEKAAQAAAINLRCAGLLVNVVDRPDLCDFTTPSILDRDPLLIAVGTGGASAGLAKHIRLRLEAILPQTLGKLARGLYAGRARLRERYPNGGDRRRAVDRALEQGGILDTLAPQSNKRLKAWLENPDALPAAECHDFTLSSDDPDNLTVRQARLLGQADVVLHDPEISDAILSRARADAQRHALPYPELAKPTAPTQPTPGLMVILRMQSAD